MDAKLIFSASYGLHTITRHITAPILQVEKSYGKASWMDTAADISGLVP